MLDEDDKHRGARDDRGGDDAVDDDDDVHDDDDEALRDVLLALAHAPAIDPDEKVTQPAPGTRLLHFVVLERLGAGGMGVVYKARDERLERLVALKVLSSRDMRDAQRRAWLLREARSAAAVSHPSIAAIYEVGEADGVAFIAMELVQGATLRARMGGRPTPLPEALELAWQIARGLARAHQAGIVHRDLKPDNVMVADDGQVKILDFGLARPIEPGERRESLGALRASGAEAAFATRGGQVKGTPAYMSPEQRRGQPVDARSDVFSFGVLLHELLTGKLPEDGGAGGEEGADAKVSVRKRGGELPAAIEPLVARCLRARAEDRFADGVALSDALNHLRQARTVSRPATLSVRGARFATSASVVVLAGIVAAAGIARRRPAVPPAPDVAASAAAPPVAATLKRLTANPADNPIAHASLAPDGRSVAYVDRTGAYVERLGATPGSPVRVALPEGASAELVAWMPASDLLVVSGQRPGRRARDLWLATSNGEVARTLGEGEFTGLAVSPDGTRLAFAEEERVSVMPIDGGAPALALVKKEAGCFITELSWSPDGGRIAYESLCFGSLRDAAVESVPSSGGAIEVALSDPRLAQESGVGGMVWTEGAGLIYALAEWFPAENGSNLWSLPLDPRSGKPGGAPRKLTDWAGTLASVLSVDRRGERLAFLRFDFQADVYVGDIESGGRRLARPRRLTMTDRNERPATWSADSEGVYFISDRHGLYDVFYQGIGDMDARVVVAEPGSETGAQLTPDGAAILYWALPKIDTPRTVTPVLMRARIDGSEATALWTASGTTYPEGAGRPQPWEMRFRCARELAAGSNRAPVTGTRTRTPGCVVSEKQGVPLVFRALDPSGGAREELRRIEAPTAASFFWDLSPDGTRLAIPSENGPVRVESLDGRLLGERRVPDGCDPIYVTWAADGRGLFVSAECSNAPVFRLYFVPERGAASLVWDDSPDWILGTEASPDGKHLAIAVKHADNDVWMLELPAASSAAPAASR